jgi:hypothetical protein
MATGWAFMWMGGLGYKMVADICLSYAYLAQLGFFVFTLFVYTNATDVQLKSMA